MLDFDVQRFTRKCHKTEREFAPGDEFYSALIARGAAVERWDFAPEAWDGPPENTIGWWKSRVPDPQARTLHWAPSDIVLHYFEQLENDASKNDLRYILALWLVRRRIMRLEAVSTDADGAESGEILQLYCPRNEREYRVDVVTPDAARMTAIQAELTRLLFADGN